MNDERYGKNKNTSKTGFKYDDLVENKGILENCPLKEFDVRILYAED
jgi:hypothetical protein